MSEREYWRRHFADTLLSGDSDEVAVAADAAVDALRRGGDGTAARTAGRAAAQRHRAMAPGRGRGYSQPATWPAELAVRLFSPPARWGWQAVRPAAAPPPAPPVPLARPTWVEPPRPDSSAMRSARSRATTKLVVYLAFSVLSVVTFTAFQDVIEEQVADYGSSGTQVYQASLVVVGVLLVLQTLRSMAAIGRAGRSLRAFEQPYLALRDAERERYRTALDGWERATREHAEATAAAAREAAVRAAGPRWHPIAPRSEPSRVDVLGGDPHRHGWASLLVTVGSALLSGGNRITVFDFTGQDVGGGLLHVAGAAGMGVGGAELARVDLLGALPRNLVPDCLARALIVRDERDERTEERVHAAAALRTVVDCLDGAVTFGRLAAGVRVLRQGSADARLSEVETARLVDAHLSDVDQGEWTARQLRLLSNRLDVLLDTDNGPDRPMWTQQRLTVVASAGRRGDRDVLLDRLLVQVALAGIDGGSLHGVLVVAGADHLGTDTLRALSDHTRQAGVRLMLLIDQPQGDLEKTVGTGGAVCVMKMYNHRDATVAAEFIGKGHRFVISQVTRQVGRTFSDGGGDSFTANTSAGVNRGLGKGRSDSRGHAWSGTRNWSAADNIGTSSTSGRVYEFVVEPHEILGMPETAFILVDNTSHGRRVTMVDGNPGICLLDRVAREPLEAGA